MKRKGTPVFWEACIASAVFLYADTAAALSALPIKDLTSAVTAGIIAFACAAVFSRILPMPIQAHGAWAKALAVLAAVGAVVLCAVYAARCAQTMRIYAAFYEKDFVRCSMAAALSVCGAYAAKGGKRTLAGFLCVTAVFFAAAFLFSLTAFLSAKSIAPLQAPALSASKAWEALPAALRVLADTLVIGTLFGFGYTDEEKQARRGYVYGVGAWAGALILHTLRDRLLLGEGLLALAENPGLCAFRLAPGFELPEVGVLLTTFAVTVRVGVYGHFSFRLLCGTFGKTKRLKDTFFAAYALAVTVIAVLGVRFFASDGVLTLGASALCALAVFGTMKKRKKS